MCEAQEIRYREIADSGPQQRGAPRRVGVEIGTWISSDQPQQDFSNNPSSHITQSFALLLDLCFLQNIVPEWRFTPPPQLTQANLILGKRLNPHLPGNGLSRWQIERLSSYQVTIGQRVLFRKLCIPND